MKNVHIGWGPVGMTKIITKKSTKLKLNKTSVTLELGAEFQLSIISEFEETPVWKSSNEAVVIVDQDGNVTVMGYGTAYITVTSGELQGTCVIKVPEPVIPEEPEPEPDPEPDPEPEPDEPEVPEEPENKLDNTKIYYGIIKEPEFMSFAEMTEGEILSAVAAGTINTTAINTMNQVLSVSAGDAVVVLIPTGIYKAYKDDGSGSNAVKFEDKSTGLNFHANGEIKLENHYVFGEFFIATGNLKIYVE